MLLKENIPFTYTFGKIKYEISFVVLYATAIAVIHSQFPLTEMSIPLTVPSILGTVISLLLAFRSNQAYDRWWEARHVWGAIVNDSRTLARQVVCFSEAPGHEEELQRFKSHFIKRQIAWCYCLGQSLRGKDTLGNMDRLLTKKEITFLADYSNAPSALLDLHARDLKKALDRGWINSLQQIELDETITRLCDAMGKCERIKNTVFPVTYSHYLHFMLVFFILMLPFGLIEFFGFLEIPLLTGIAASFLLVEKMAIHLQDPFENNPTDTPVTAIAQTIEKNLRQMLSENDFPQENETKKFYVL
jgi:ion channel-forming bestrophin family protein